jgi:glutathione S-transferase
MKFFTLALTSLSAFATTSALAAPNLELKYFGARGAAETARIILALADKEYKDTRYEITPGTMSAPDFLAEKESGDLDINLGRAPLLLVDGKPIGQSKAIERYLATQFGLMGNSDVESAQIDCIAEHCRDVKDAQGKKGFSFFSRDKSEEEKDVLRKEWFENEMPTMLEKIEKAVKITSQKDGYAFGDKDSYADVAIFSLLKDCTIDDDKTGTWEASGKCALLMSIADRIAKDAKVAKWVESRPTSMF